MWKQHRQAFDTKWSVFHLTCVSQAYLVWYKWLVARQDFDQKAVLVFCLSSIFVGGKDIFPILWYYVKILAKLHFSGLHRAIEFDSRSIQARVLDPIWKDLKQL